MSYMCQAYAKYELSHTVKGGIDPLRQALTFMLPRLRVVLMGFLKDSPADYPHDLSFRPVLMAVGRRASSIRLISQGVIHG